MTSALDKKSTEEKIKEAARIVFYKKGFAATRTRDIAEQADINLALLNYYFRSKQKLFEVIMLEVLTGFIKNLVIALNNDQTTFEDKIQDIAIRYIDLISKEPEIPTFIITEIRNNPQLLLKHLPIKEIMSNSVFFKQHKELVTQKRISEPNPLHFLMNMMGLIVFPFIIKPLLIGSQNIQLEEFDRLMQDRKKLIPIWIQSMFIIK
ncbi:TetR/AcrR family transcriptional regulator [Flavobacterium adhaerens]|uniref:TetR/AcrR family transcriptional regulator n=1 Tax=Flavobacterium adhaerens TaxID=3149043 RepID=UPI0032B5A907